MSEAKKSLHRIAAPKSYPIHRKESHYVIKPVGGMHSKSSGVPLLIVLRDVLGAVDNRRECKTLLNEGKVKVDGKVRRDPSFMVGFMDSIVVPSHNYRVLMSSKGKVDLVEIPDDEADKKICRIEDIQPIKGGKFQYQLHDGRNILLDEKKYDTNDSVLISLPGQDIEESIPFDKGSFVFVIDGKNVGETGEIEEIHRFEGSQSDKVIISSKEGKRVETVIDYIFPIGEDSSLVKVR